MSMPLADAPFEFSDFSVTEWNRLDRLGNKFDVALKTIHTRVVVLGPVPLSVSLIKEVVTDCVVETGVGTAHVYGMQFDPKSSRYRSLIEDLTDNFIKVVANDSAKDKVRQILPTDLSLSDRSNRLDVFGLSSRDAIRLEHMRQKGISGRRIADARLHMQLQRGNLVALTEVNRIINQTVETVWLDNMDVSKARKSESGILLEHAGRVTAITSLRGIPARARKTVVTRRDNRTCDYCWPLEGTTARIGASYRTKYGVFPHPPFHPRCRCYQIVRY